MSEHMSCLGAQRSTDESERAQISSAIRGQRLSCFLSLFFFLQSPCGLSTVVVVVNVGIRRFRIVLKEKNKRS